MRTSELPRLTRLSERRKGYLLVSAAALRRSQHLMLIKRRSPSLNLPAEFCPIFSLPLARRSE